MKRHVSTLILIVATLFLLPSTLLLAARIQAPRSASMHAYDAPSSESVSLADTVKIEWVGSIGGDVHAVDVSSSYAYVGEGSALVIVDMSNPANPTPLSRLRLPGMVYGVQVVGDYAYIANDDEGGLQIVHSSNPSAPTIVGSVDTPGSAFDVAVAGNYAYVADWDSALHVIDISTPSAPTIVGSVAMPGSAKSIVTAGTYAYVADGSEGLQVLDISTPSAPTIVGSVDTPGNAASVAVAAGYAYVADNDSGIQVIDMSTPSAPTIVGSVDTPDLAESVAVADGYAYVADWGSGLQVIDISTPSAPTIVGSVDTPDLAGSVAVADGYAYVADGRRGMQVIDINTPSTPAIVASVDAPDLAGSVTVAGIYAYVAAGSTGIQVLDISTPSAPTLVGSVDTPDFAASMAIADGYAYVADGSRGMQVLDISTPSAPTIVGSVDTPGNATSVAVAGNYAYVADGSRGIQVLDISTPPAPTLVGSVDTPGSAASVAIAGNYAYVADGSRGIQVLDISTPSAPTLVGSVDTPVYAESVAVADGYAYVADGGSGMQVLDISTPFAPSIVGSVDTPVYARSVAVADGYACVADDEGGLQVINIRTPSTPAMLGSVDTPGSASSVAVADGYAYVADGSSGLQIFRVKVTLSPHTPTPTPTDTPLPTSTPTSTPMNTPTPTFTPAPTATPTPQRDGYEPNDTCANASSIPTNGTVQQHTFHQLSDTDWLSFDVVKDAMYIIEVQVPPESLVDVAAELYPNCSTAQPDENQNYAFSPGARFTFEAPTNGLFMLKLFNQAPASTDSTAHTYTVSVRNLSNPTDSTGALIIVAGKIKDNDPVQPHIDYVAEEVYRLFRQNDYTDDQITYLATDLSMQGVDAIPTSDGLELAITTAKVAVGQSLTLYLVDHGTRNYFYLDKQRQQWITAEELHNWLNVFEMTQPEARVNVIIEACYSGSFVSSLKTLGEQGKQRVVITSTSGNQLAYAVRSPAKGAFFSNHFLSTLAYGGSLYNSFQKGEWAVQNNNLFQTPQLDANGNGIVNEEEDQAIAAQRGFGYPEGGLSEQWPPHIAEVSAPSQVAVDERGLIAVEVYDDTQVDQVLMTVYPPSYTPPQSGEEMVIETVETLGFTDKGNSQYEALYSGFEEPGTYQLVIQAEDNEGLLSQPKLIEVTVGGDGDMLRVYLPLVRR